MVYTCRSRHYGVVPSLDTGSVQISRKPMRFPPMHHIFSCVRENMMVSSHDHTRWSHGLKQEVPYYMYLSKTVEIPTPKSLVQACGISSSDLPCMLHEIVIPSHRKYSITTVRLSVSIYVIVCTARGKNYRKQFLHFTYVCGIIEGRIPFSSQSVYINLE
jgi:hypothetical protein